MFLEGSMKMEEHVVRILSSQYIADNVKVFKVEKPKGYSYLPGQATEVSINKPEWREEKRPFTFTSLNTWDHLEFTIKIYRQHNGVTNQLEKLQRGDELILRDVWGAIRYQGEGVFLAGGAGITPFIAILRQLDKDGRIGNNMLIFSNRTSRDIILGREFRQMLGPRFHNVLTKEHVIGFMDKRIDEDYLKETIRDFSRHFYVCGPESFVKDIRAMLITLGARPQAVVVEK